MQFKTGNIELVRKINKSTILKIIREKGPISRADIARISKLNPTTVSNNVQILLDSKIIKEVGNGESSGGRRPMLLELDGNSYYCIGIHMKKNEIIAAIVNLDGTIKYQTSSQLKEEKNKEDVLEVLKLCISKVIQESKLNREVFLGIGIGVHGIVEAESGISVYAPKYNWRNVNIKEIIEKEFEIPVFINNDVNTMALGEKWFGAAKKADNFIVIHIGNGIGSAIVIDKKLYSGINNAAGEIGHINILNNGPKCVCGNYGCLDAVASGEALVKYVISQIQMGATTNITQLVNDDLSKINEKVICEAAKMRDKLALDTLEQCGKYLGIAISSVVNLLNPNMIIISGTISFAGDYIFNSLIEVVKKKSMKECLKDVSIIGASLKEEGGVIGASTLVLQTIFGTH